MLDAPASPPWPGITAATTHPAAAATARSPSGLTCWSIWTGEHRRSAPQPARWPKTCPVSCAAPSTTNWPDAAAPFGSAPDAGPGRPGQGAAAPWGLSRIPLALLLGLKVGGPSGLTLPAVDAEGLVFRPIPCHRGLGQGGGVNLSSDCTTRRATTPGDRVQGPATAGGLGLPGLAPVIVALVVQQPVELPLDPTTQVCGVEPLRQPAPLAAACTARPRPGSGHPIDQLPPRLHPAVETLLQTVVIPTRHRCRLAATHPGPTFKTQSQQGDPEPRKLQGPQKDVDRTCAHDARLSACTNASRQLACQRPPCRASQQWRQASPCTRRR